MRIGIDARFYGPSGKGLGRYVSELLTELERIDRENEYLVFLRDDNFGEYRPQSPNFRKVRAEFPWYGWREQLVMPFWLERFDLDLMHFTHFNVPFLYRRPFVVTIHDLILLSHPTPRATTLGPLAYRLKYLAYRAVIRQAVRKARQVITVSEYSRGEILKNFPFLTPDRVTVTHEAGRKLPEPEEDIPIPKPKGPFALYVGSAYPHKNLDRLIESFADFRKRGFGEWSLVLIGGNDYFYRRLQAETERKGLDGNVVFYGRATDPELAILYRLADFHVFPSLCEGFGLPPLEAMHAGLPVTAAAVSCLPEILEDAADWFSPDDRRDMTGALVRMASDPGLRERLIERGQRQVAKYSWARCAEQTLETYRETIRNA
ncbi:glycosyltransferase family 4 protein [Candidatus Uhrbacteria bacterium]|nr:glycosyltransferase family 4 protein [Candidatus Uhrbacteria bacterium]